MLIIGEKINGTRKAVGKAVLEKDVAFIQNLAREQVAGGADVLDVNAGTEASREPDDLRWLVQIVQEVVDKPLSLDSPNPKALAHAVTAVKQTPFINSISGEAHRLAALPIVAERQCQVLALAIDDNGIPKDVAGRMAVVNRLFEETRKAGVLDENVYVDPLVTAIATDAKACELAMECMRTIKSAYPKAHLTCGLSNISYCLPARAVLNRSFMTLAMLAGLDSAIMDPNDRGLIEAIYATQVLLGQDRHCMKFSKAFSAGKIGPAKKA
jgi:5-methyltetrahydrofolate--homocysteine methyltransferase